jgi:hypothetical protein
VGSARERVGHEARRGFADRADGQGITFCRRLEDPDREGGDLGFGDGVNPRHRSFGSFSARARRNR